MHERDEKWEPGPEGLWSAVLMVAVEDVRGRRLSIALLRGRLSINSARQRLQSPDGGSGSFAWVCDILGLEVELVLRLALGAVAPSSLATPDIMSEVKSFLAP
jgi:hypothetical protein